MSNKTMHSMLIILMIIVAVESYFLYLTSKKLWVIRDGKSTALLGAEESEKEFDERLKEEWDPLVELQQARKHINNIFDQSLLRAFKSPQFKQFYSGRVISPDADVTESDSEYTVKIDIPGLGEKDYHVEFKNGLLIITGQKQSSLQEIQEGDFYRGERSFGYFARTIPLPDDIDPVQINTEYDKGVLTITIPKS